MILYYQKTWTVLGENIFPFKTWAVQIFIQFHANS